MPEQLRAFQVFPTFASRNVKTLKGKVYQNDASRLDGMNDRIRSPDYIQLLDYNQISMSCLDLYLEIKFVPKHSKVQL